MNGRRGIVVIGFVVVVAAVAVATVVVPETAGPAPSPPESVTRPASAPPAGPPAKPLAPAVRPDHDGPYVYWDDDLRVHVMSWCEGTVHVGTHDAADGVATFVDPCPHGADGPRYTAYASHVPPPAQFDDVDRVLAVSDVEGRYDVLVKMLRGNGVIDDANRWSFGTGHLVLVGDSVDRGDRVTETLWLVHRLEREASAAGGRVHLILGNHEVMIMGGDVRYVHEKYRAVTAAFRVGYTGLYGPNTEFGRWLRSRPTVVRINDVLFVHGGLAPAAAGALTIDAINDTIRTSIDDRRGAARDELSAFLIGSGGPLWYRGWVVPPHPGADAVAATIEHYGARTAVVGHSIVERVERRLGGRVIPIDTTFVDADKARGVLWEHGTAQVVDVHGARQTLH